MKLVTLNGIDVGKDKICVFLRKRIKGSSGWNNAAKEGMIVFDMELLIGSIKAAEEQRGFLRLEALFSKAKTSENSPPLSVRIRGNRSPKTTPS